MPYKREEKKKDDPCSLSQIGGRIGSSNATWTGALAILYLKALPWAESSAVDQTALSVTLQLHEAANGFGLKKSFQQRLSCQGAHKAYAAIPGTASLGLDLPMVQPQHWPVLYLEGNCSLFILLFFPLSWQELGNDLLPQLCSPGSIFLQFALILNRRERWQWKKTFPSEQCLFPRACHNTKYN